MELAVRLARTRGSIVGAIVGLTTVRLLIGPIFHAAVFAAWRWAPVRSLDEPDA